MAGGQLNDDRSTRARFRWVILWVLVAGTIAYLVAVPAGLVGDTHRLSVQEIALVAVVLFCSAFSVQNRYSLTDLSLGPGGVSAKFNRLEGRQDALESEVHALSVAVGGLVSKWEFRLLEMLADDRPAVVRYGDIMLTQLDHLDAMTYLRPTTVRGLNALREDHGSGMDEFDLKGYVEITQDGREYLALRAKLMARAAQASAGQAL